LPLPPGFAAEPGPVRTAGLLREDSVHPSVAAGLAATCSPRVGVLVRCSPGDVAAALGVRGDLGGSMVRAGGSDVEVAAWPAGRLGAELAAAVPALDSGPRPMLHLPLDDLARHPALRREVAGRLEVRVVAPPRVVGRLAWLATPGGWLSLEAAEVRAGVRWATVRPVEPADLPAVVAPLIAMALA
jgi:hypothetical protein